MDKVIQHLRSVAFRQHAAAMTDKQLLEIFVAQRDDVAFAALVRKHARMVWNVCRRVLSNHHDAEDAFQATFVILFRKAPSIASRELLANWLYGVAYRTALKAKTALGKRHKREQQVADMPEPDAREQDLWTELLPLLDRELSRLPEKYRTCIVLCDLEGKTRKEAAQLLGLPEGTIGSRHTRARAMLAKRLARLGLAVSSGSLTAVLSQNAAAACVPAGVVSATTTAIAVLAAGQASLAGVISAEVARLTEGVLKAMFLAKLKLTMAALLAVVLGIGMAASTLRYGAVAGQVDAAGQAADKHAAAPMERDSAAVAGASQQTPGKSIQQPGVVKAFEQISIFSRITGFAGTVNVDIGDRVKKGEVLTRLYVPEVAQDLKTKAALADLAAVFVKQSELDQALAKEEVERAKVKLDLALASAKAREATALRWEAEYLRGKALADKGVFDNASLDEVISQRDTAKAAADRAKAEIGLAEADLSIVQVNQRRMHIALKAAQLRLKDAESARDQVQATFAKRDIAAPFDGVVTQRNVHMGWFVVAGAWANSTKSADPLFVVVRTDKLRIAVSVPEADASLVTVGAPVVIRIPSLKGKEVQAKVTTISPALDDKTRTLAVEIEIPNPQDEIRLGMHVDVEIILNHKEPDMIKKKGGPLGYRGH